MRSIGERLAFLDQMMPYAADEAAFGRFYADIHDLVEISEWFLAKVEEASANPLTADEIETLLVDIDVHFAEHATWHIKSLRKEIGAMLVKFEQLD